MWWYWLIGWNTDKCVTLKSIKLFVFSVLFLLINSEKIKLSKKEKKKKGTSFLSGLVKLQQLFKHLLTSPHTEDKKGKWSPVTPECENKSEFILHHLTCNCGGGGEKKGFKTFYYFFHAQKSPASTDSFTLRQSVAEVEAEEEAELGTNMAAPVGAPFLNHPPTPFSPIDINKPTSMTENAFCRVSLMGTQSDVLITGKTVKVSETTYFNCWQSISTGVLGIAESV